MPVINSFKLKNFKGIEEIALTLEDRASCPVTTLIGLNESGKTTILEGLSQFVSGDRSVSGLFDGVHSSASGAGLIPVHKKAAFSSDIEITGEVALDSQDVEEIVKVARKNKLDVDIDALKTPFAITKRFRFEDSKLKGNRNIWSFVLNVRNRGVRNGKFKQYVRPEKEENDLWMSVVNIIQPRLPQVTYFPTFLVDMPRRIYLQEHTDEKPVNRHYRFVFQDILDSLGDGLTLERHVSKRIADFKEEEKSANWFSKFHGSANKSPIDSVFQKISNAVTKEVLGSWQRVFQRAISAKSILVEWSIDTEKADLPYASFYLSDGESRYAISERSLGFRWFFSFLLFTAFKQAKSRRTIFIFDEPAANLHAKAQAELLTSFSRIASEGNRIIYSTHSHHMINPHWLSGAYIVENSALDYDIEDSFGLSSKPTNIKATKYRNFVSDFPTRSSYFQPVIEKLEYVSPEVIGKAPYVVVEGITDYYALSIAQRLGGLDLCYRFIPGVGSGALGPLISQMLGKGERFTILLDDDMEGKKAAEKYRSDFYLGGDSVLTLADVDASFVGRRMEGLLGEDTLDIIKTRHMLERVPTKKQIGWYLAEANSAAALSEDIISKNALENLKKILLHFQEKFSL